MLDPRLVAFCFLLWRAQGLLSPSEGSPLPVLVWRGSTDALVYEARPLTLTWPLLTEVLRARESCPHFSVATTQLKKGLAKDSHQGRIGICAGISERTAVHFNGNSFAQQWHQCQFVAGANRRKKKMEWGTARFSLNNFLRFAFLFFFFWSEKNVLLIICL